jgi:hypothetical protein
MLTVVGLYVEVQDCFVLSCDHHAAGNLYLLVVREVYVHVLYLYVPQK